MVLLRALSHLVVIELVPISVIQRVRRVMTSRKLALVVGDSEEVIQGAVGWFLSGDDKLRHVETIRWKVDKGVLFRIGPSEPL